MEIVYQVDGTELVYKLAWDWLDQQDAVDDNR